MYEAAASCKYIARAPVANRKYRGVTLAGYYALRYGMKVQLVTPQRIIHLQGYEVTLRCNVTSVSPYLFNMYSKYILRRVGFKDNIGIRIWGRTINNLRVRYADDTTVLTEDKEDMRKLLKKLKGVRKPD